MQNELWKFCALNGGVRKPAERGERCMMCGTVLPVFDPAVIVPAGIHPDSLCPMGYTNSREKRNDDATKI